MDVKQAPHVETPVAEESSSDGPNASESPKRVSVWRRLLGLIWDTFEGDPEERKFVRKVDYFLL